MTGSTDDSIGHLLGMPEREFERVVSVQINPGKRSGEVWGLLLSPEVLPRLSEMLDVLHIKTKDALKHKAFSFERFMDAHAELGTTNRSVRAEGRREWQGSFQASTRFLAYIEAAQIQVKHRLKQAGLGEGRQAFRRAVPALQRLVTALVAHKDEMGDDASQADEDLWDLLDDVNVIIHGKSMTLRQAHESSWEKPATPAAGGENGCDEVR